MVNAIGLLFDTAWVFSPTEGATVHTLCTYLCPHSVDVVCAVLLAMNLQKFNKQV